MKTNNNYKKTNKATTIDKIIGQKIKLKRIEFGLSQARLGKVLGVTYQQVQKCEKGENRVPASRLFEIAGLFKTDLDWFFEGLDKNGGLLTKKLNIENLNLTRDNFKLNKLFKEIKSETMRRLVVDIVRCFVKAE